MDWKRYSKQTAHKVTELCNEVECIEVLKLAIKDKIDLSGEVLDAGSGQSTKILRNYFTNILKANYNACDVNPGKDVTQCDLHEVSKFYRPEQFNIIFCSNVMEHLASPVVVFNEFNKILKKEGWLILGLPIGEGHDISHEHYINLTQNQVINLCIHFGFLLSHGYKVGTMNFYMCQKIKKLR